MTVKSNFDEMTVILCAKAIELQVYAQKTARVAKSRELTTRQLNKLLQAQRLIQKAADMLDDIPFSATEDEGNLEDAIRQLL